jgi:hypothetical protein
MGGIMLDPSRPVANLAAAIVGLPDGTDLSRVGLEILLTGGPPPTGSARDPLLYARIFSEATTVARTPWMRLACRLQAVNGLRRDPAQPMAPIAEELAEISAAINAELQPGQLQFALGADAGYQRGLVLRMTRRYAEAAAAQAESAAWFFAAEQPDKGYVGLFVSAVESASAALCRGDRAKIRASLAHLRQMRQVVRVTCSTYPKWMQENAAVHLWWAYLLAEMAYPERGVDEEEVTRSSAHWAATAQVARALRAKESDAVAKALAEADRFEGFQSSSMANAVLTMRLLAAKALMRENQTRRAKAIFRQIANWQGPDGGVPAAIALGYI